MKKISFEPIVDKNCRVLILGTMPGNKSIQKQQYYADGRNQFWRILSAITGDDFHTDYEDKKRLLLKNHIAIWDVLMHCKREGSLDKNISDEFPNDFSSFYLKFSKINSVFFNGGKASEYYCQYVDFCKRMNFCTLPSSSSANTSKSFEEKIKIWKEKILKVVTDE